ncbi:protein kinase [Nostoc sp. DedQUE09]|uniref:protein kinase n=1 Tax=Nostoc sp. DedQUE09 TaxID=3075394 RepID=UPI002AD53D1C|nr:protein kinase [Nostoc sp. DedQUE09]MDZ7950539.1 protein kinase [Nostoc sp. DedQUE09]
MVKNHLELRTKSYFKLSSQLAGLDNMQLCSLFDNNEPSTSSSSSGRNHTIVLGQFKIFVKRIPITNIEYENLFSTKNLYDLPTCFNYGVGSIGFGVFRELITHIKTTNWVLEGANATFPLMYHYRIIPFFGQRENIDMENHKSFVEYWGNNASIENYVLDRANANYELVLFLEYIPYVLETWLQENHSKLQQPLDELCTTIAFLRRKRIIHFDAHFRNILTDGKQIYLTDFGLVLDKSFSLTKDEESFFKQNQFYDYGEVLRNLGHLIRSRYDLCSENDKRRIMEKYEIKEGLKPYELGSILLDSIEQIHADGVMKLDEFYVTSIVEYRSIIALMQGFFVDMYKNNNKDTKFPHTKLRQLLKETGFISGASDYGG